MFQGVRSGRPWPAEAYHLVYDGRAGVSPLPPYRSVAQTAPAEEDNGGRVIEGRNAVKEVSVSTMPASPGDGRVARIAEVTTHSQVLSFFTVDPFLSNALSPETSMVPLSLQAWGGQLPSGPV